LLKVFALLFAAVVLSGCALLAMTSPRGESRERSVALSEMEETDLGDDPEPESVANKPRQVQKVAEPDPVVDELLVAKPRGTTPAEPTDDALLTAEEPADESAEPVDDALRATEGAASAKRDPSAASHDGRELRSAREKRRTAVETDAAADSPLAMADAASDAGEIGAPPSAAPADDAPIEAAAEPANVSIVPRAPGGDVERGVATSGSALDRSRSPTLAGSGRWDCPFPREAKRAGVDAATVTLRVEVQADSRVESVIVMSDPGDGFGREARRCALSKRWQAGLDRAGNAAKRTTVVNVKFQRKG
jgi:periplasmic protein TonB